MIKKRHDRDIRFFGKEGRERLAAVRVAVVGVGGLGVLVSQQLGLLDIGSITLIDSEELSETDRNRNPAARDDDAIPGTRKVDIAERMIKAYNPRIQIEKIHDSFISNRAFEAIIKADYVFGCLDSEGARLVLNELCAAYSRRYFDIASDIFPENPPKYGGRVCVAWNGKGCIACYGLLDLEEAQADLAGPDGRRNRDAIYGVPRENLDRTGPSVISINGVVASLGVTEFMVAVTGIRSPKPVMTYHGHTGKVTVSTDEPLQNCYYCKGIRGKGDSLDVQHYIREGVGKFLR